MRSLSSKFAIIPVILVIALASAYLWTRKSIEINPSTQTVSTTTTFPTPNESNDCDQMVDEIDDMLDAANYCEVDSDCTDKVAVGYPFGCTNLVNQNSDIDMIVEAFNNYANECHPYEYDCPEPPQPENIKCLEGICVDTTNLN